MSKQSKDYLDEKETKELKFKYKLAFDKLSTYLNVLVSDYELKNGVSTVVHATGRIKKIDSAINKLVKKKKEKHENVSDIKIDASELENTIGDMVGVRLVCPFKEDVYDLVELIKSSGIVKIYDEKDFIKNPKESGYRSYHILVEIPITYRDKQVMVKCEIQLRSSIMDSWASMEHAIKYKPKGSKKLTAEQKKRLITCANACMALEETMSNLRHKKMKEVGNEKTIINEYEYKISEEDLKEFADASVILKSLLNNEIENYNLCNSTRLVEHINSRLKKPSSIYRKLSEKNLEFNMYNVKNKIDDISAVRYVCRSVEDVYEMAHLIEDIASDEGKNLIRIVEVKDYIKKPKESGYRGLHLIVEVPVPRGDSVQFVRSEIQIRTSLMHSWAVMDDLIKYHQDYEYTEVEKMMLKVYAESLSEIDDYMGGFFHPDSIKTKHILEKYFSPYEEDKLSIIDDQNTLVKKKLG